MKKIFYQLMAISLLSAICLNVFGQSAAKRLKARPKGSTSLPYGYYEYLPSNYQAKSNHPIVIFFHGINEKGNGTSDLKKVLRVGPTKLVSQGKDFPFILISPQIKGGWWGTAGIQTLINYIKRTYKVDENRIYITGLSAGGFGTWLAGQTLTNQVAAIVPICGCGDNKQAAKMKNLPVWAFHNSGDPTINIKCSTTMVDAIKSAGGKPKLTIYKSYSHNAWSNAYNDQNMWNWLLSQRRGRAAIPEKDTKNPIVNAGSDRTLILPNNSISISANVSGGKISSYYWTKISGPNVKLINNNKREVKLSSLQKGTYVFRVTVKDNSNLTAYDDVKVYVNAKASSNKAPIVNAGKDRNLTLPANSTSLTAYYSDQDGKISSVKWYKLSGPSVTLSNTTKSTLYLSKLVAGTYYFRVSVKDNKNATSSDDVKLVVSKKTPSRNIAPTVSAGPDRIITLPEKSVTLEATCNDKDGMVIYTLWNKVSGPSVKMNYYNQRKTVLTDLVEGTYVFRITVMDNVMGPNRGKAVDEVRIVVKKSNQHQDEDVKPSGNIPPTVSAGPDKIITLPQKYVTLTADYGDKDGNVNYTLWWKISGPSVKMTNYEQKTLYLSDLNPGTYVFRITVMDDAKGNRRGKAEDYVKLTVKKGNSSARLGVTETETPEIKMFPNPTHDKFYLQLNSKENSDARITILNEKGAVVQQGNSVIKAGESSEINLSGHPAGVYFIRVYSGEKETTLRLVKE